MTNFMESHLPSTCLAAATTVSVLNPNFFNSSFNGAEAPKVCIPIILPFGPTYRSQPTVAAITTETRALTLDGSTDSLYPASCSSNSSQHGMLTTLALIPSAFSSSYAPTAHCNSDPLAMRMTSGLPPSASPSTYAPFATPAAEAYVVRSSVGIA